MTHEPEVSVGVLPLGSQAGPRGRGGLHVAAWAVRRRLSVGRRTAPVRRATRRDWINRAGSDDFAALAECTDEYLPGALDVQVGCDAQRGAADASYYPTLGQAGRDSASAREADG
jgi:hypothetical protein